MRLKHLFYILGILAVVIVGACFLGAPSEATPPDKGKPPKQHERQKLSTRNVRTVNDLKARREAKPKAAPKVRERADRVREPLPDQFSAHERELIGRMEDALDIEDFDAVVAACADIQNSTNAAVRLRVVEALGWFGQQALPELTLFLADADEDVRESALQEWGSGVSDIEDDELKGEVVEATMGTISNRDMLEDIAFYLNELPDTMAVDIQVALINGENQTAAKIAREAYEFTTGEAYTDIDAAQKWVDENSDDDDDDDNGS